MKSQDFIDRYKDFVRLMSSRIDMDLLYEAYQHREAIKECYQWEDFGKFMNFMKLTKNPVPPVGYHLTQTDESGHIDEERFVCHLPESLGDNGVHYFGSTAAEAIYKAVSENN